MDSQYDLSIKKPVSVWNRGLDIKPKDFFISLAKVATNAATGNASGALDNLVTALTSTQIQDKPAYAAWALVYNSLQYCLNGLMTEYQEFFTDDVPDRKLKKLSVELETALNKIEIGLDNNFFDQPHKLPLLEEIRPALVSWLIGLGMTDSQANAFHTRMKSRFVLALHKQWLENASDYQCIIDALDSPFINATKVQRGWMQYNAYLEEQTHERMFAEAFSLKQVYVPLRAYYNEKNQVENDDELQKGDIEKKNIVVDLQDELEEWVRHFDENLSVRMISGGPGAGKSSFAKMFAAHVAETLEEVPVLFIPLHHFDPSGDLINSVEQFIRNERYLSGSPLDASNGKDRLLIIFDGLDELAMQGQVAAETANAFVDEVITKLDKFNAQGLQRQALITGRDLAIQSTSQKLRANKQTLHVLPYFMSKEEAKSYDDSQQRLSIDQRDLWWRNYGKVKGKPYKGMPKVLKIPSMIPITREPLLNYLVALSYQRDNVHFSEQTSLNTIYQDLLEAVYQRQWDHGQHKSTMSLKKDQFIRILEEIALAVWHGDGRTATVEKIYQQCKKGNLDRYLIAFQEGAEKGVSRLLAAFYFRQSDQLSVGGDKTFEFTHKSFGEFLIAKRIVRAIRQLHSELERHEEDPDTGMDERAALKRWAELCGPTAIDHYIFKFLCDEVTTHPTEFVAWQATFANLLGHAIRNGMPMEQAGIPRFKDMMEHSRNAEEMLMVVHYACAKQAKQISKINFGKKPAAFGEWLQRIKGQITGPFERKLIRYCFGYLELSREQLHHQDLYRSNLESSNLIGALLNNALLCSANLVEANITDANLRLARLNRAKLVQANLTRIALTEADLTEADLTEADLTEADLTEVDLTGANLTGANLTGANLTGAN
ncbi:MAG: pentapeptide repeat-containing protein, partial [Oceanospirillaceae bacterium]|nr:pentapeptide repeat-containing protein [Oceanospirillaceae bacterium]